MRSRGAFLALLSASVLYASDWDPAAAARYLDGREQEWFAWKVAQTPEGVCVSCHTNMPYLLARPALRKVLKEAAPTEWETKLGTRLRSQAGHERKVNIQTSEVIFGALLLANDLSTPAGQAAHLQLRDLEVKEGPLLGVWQWYDAKLDPWESAGALSYGAALAALSGMADTKQTVDWLRNNRDSAPLHSRLAMLWAGPKVPGLFQGKESDALVAEIVSKQSTDGSWTIQSLGPWMAHPDAPAQPEGGHPYATAFAAYVLRGSNAAEAKSSVSKAQTWLRANQDKTTGAWAAPSMNKKFPEGSMESKFMQDAATAFAVLALIE